MKEIDNSGKRLLTANEYTDVRDISRKVLHTKSDYSMGYLRIFPMNIELLSKDEKVGKCETLTAALKPETKAFSLYSIPRTVDMDEYINFLVQAYDNEISSSKRRMLLNEMIVDANDTVMNGQNFEHQFYLQLWDKSSKKNINIVLEERLNDFEQYFSTIQNQTKRLDDTEIIKLCNLFANSSTATIDSYDDIQNSYFPMISEMGEEG